MFCFIYRWLISWSMDSGKPLPSYVNKHMQACDSCREFTRASQRLSERLVREAREVAVPQATELSEKIIASLSYSRSVPPDSEPKKFFIFRPAFAYALVLLIMISSAIWLTMPGVRVDTPDNSFSLGDSPVVVFLNGDSLNKLTESVESPIQKEMEGLKQAAASAKDFFVNYLNPDPGSLL